MAVRRPTVDWLQVIITPLYLWQRSIFKDDVAKTNSTQPPTHFSTPLVLSWLLCGIKQDCPVSHDSGEESRSVSGSCGTSGFAVAGKATGVT